MKEEVEMGMKEAERFSVMQQVDKKILTIIEAGKELGLSLRQVKRVRKRYLSQGAQGLISLKKGKVSNRRICQGTRIHIMKLVETQYADFGPTLAREKLESRHGIRISSETLRKWFIEEGFWRSKRKKEIRVHQRRTRRSCFGEMLQGDGSPHDWLETRGPRCTLLQFVDDATSKTTVARFVLTEGTDEYLALLEEMNRRFGKEAALPEDAHRPLRTQDDLKRIFARKDQRKLSKNLTFQHQGILYRVF